MAKKTYFLGGNTKVVFVCLSNKNPRFLEIRSILYKIRKNGILTRPHKKVSEM